MKFKNAAAVYAIAIGISMIGMWMVFYLGGNIPELTTEPIRVGTHIFAEVITAVILIAGGIGVLAGLRWGRDVYLLSLGMLIYTLVQSPGYFMQTGDYGLIAVFGVLLTLAVMIVGKMIIR